MLGKPPKVGLLKSLKFEFRYVFPASEKRMVKIFVISFLHV